MSREETHTRDHAGRIIQIVTAERLTEILRKDGDSLDRPREFRPNDQWFVVGEDDDDDDAGE